MARALLRLMISAAVLAGLISLPARAAENKMAAAKARAELYAQKSLEYRKQAPRQLTPSEFKAEQLMAQAGRIIPGCESPEQTEPAIKLYRDAVKTAPGYDQAWWGLAMALWAKATLMTQEPKPDKQAARAVLQQARQACEAALKINPMSPGGNYWLSNVILTEAGLKNIVQQAFLLPEIFKLTDKVAEVDPFFDYGAVFRTYATVLVAVPGWLSRSLGFEPQIILPYLDKSIELEPDCFVNYISRADVYLKVGGPANRDLALKDLEYVITRSPDSLPGYEADNRARQKAAAKTWRQITGRDFPAR